LLVHVLYLKTNYYSHKTVPQNNKHSTGSRESIQDGSNRISGGLHPPSRICRCTWLTTGEQRVYALLVQIPAGKITSYATLAKVLDTSPRAIGGALRNNPFAPEVPCHRVIAADGYVGGFKGDWEKAPSGINQAMKLELLKGEGVEFDEQGRLLTGGGKAGTAWFHGPWKL
jgi:methylated-DNA-[protein]-cysteine S-methyltransferase